MASTKKKRLACGHLVTDACESCKNCKSCHSKWKEDAPAAAKRVNELTVSLGQSAEREERLRQMVSRGGLQFIERRERDLALARIAIMRRKLSTLLDTAVRDPANDEYVLNKNAIQSLLNEDDQTRTREVEDVLFEAENIAKQPKPVRQK